MVRDGAFKVRYRPLGDQGVVVQCGEELSLEVNGRVRAFARLIKEERVPGVTQLIPAQNSLAVRYDPVRADYAELVKHLQALEHRVPHVEPSRGKTVHLPVVYGGSWGPDLAEVADRVGLSLEDVVERHHARSYVVYMVGFSAAYPYLGDIDEALRLPRRTTPRLKVPAGSVAIAMKQTIVYTTPSPGGWHVIGWTPMATFEPWREPPSLLVAGDLVKFVPIQAEEADGWDEGRQRDWDRRWNPWRWKDE